ncbi:hypothetical protein BSKO_03562 [Bryopsis sp. KO-2023]|nr:hypothetical protein BSKO_03562 [Bryopsis sp. KO-2023]
MVQRRYSGMDAFLDLLSNPPSSVEEERERGIDLLTAAREEYLNLSAQYTEARNKASAASVESNSRLLLTKHLRAETDILCADIQENPTEEELEKRLARSRELRSQLQELRGKKDELLKIRGSKARTSKKLDVKTHKRLRDLVGVGDTKSPISKIESLPGPLYAVCSSLIAAREWVNYDVTVEEVKDSTSKKRSRGAMEGNSSVRVKVAKKGGTQAYLMLRYSAKLGLLSVDEENSDQDVVAALESIRPEEGGTAQSQLERFQQGKPNGNDDERTEKTRLAWRWLQQLGGICEMPLLTASSLLKKKKRKVEHVSAVSLLNRLHEA